MRKPLPRFVDLDLEEIEQLKAKVKRETKFCVHYLGNPFQPSEEDIRFLQENQRPCPIEGPHTDGCNLWECMIALASKKKEAAGK
jgi:hypothetical protein